MVDTLRIQLAHGGGGAMSAELVEQVILPALGGQSAGGLTDAATLNLGPSIAFTTDSYVVQPLEFPGGDIGKLAVCGTVNDLAVVGATPCVISMALVIQEGLEIALLRRILASAGQAAHEAGVAVVTGDTKVVDRSGCDGLIINTSGIGRMLPYAELGFGKICPGDRILLSGPLGEHGLAVMSRRKGLSFATELKSDCAAIHELTIDLLDALGADVHFMRDPTRGGLAATLAEVSSSAGVDIEIDESAIPVNRTAFAAAEMLGLDLLAAANEGKLVAVVASGAAEKARSILARHGIARDTAIIGTISNKSNLPTVEMVTAVGGRRIVQMPYGEELPRIC